MHPNWIRVRHVAMASGQWVVVCKIHLRGSWERQKKPHTTQKYAPQLDQCPARSDGGWSADVPWRCAVVVVCNIYLSGSCERQKEPHTTQTDAPQLDQCPARCDGGWSADVHGYAQRWWCAKII
jgi:hypothetical protein